MRHSRTTGRPVPVLGAALTTLVSLGVLAALLLLAVPPLVDVWRRVVGGEALSDVPLDVLLAGVAATALAGCGTWLATVTVATAVEVITGASSAVARALTPSCVRRVVIVCCGLAVGGAGAIPGASADPHSAADGPGTRTPASMASVLVGLPLPDRAVGDAPPSAYRGGAPRAGRRGPGASAAPARPGPGASASPARPGPGALTPLTRPGPSAPAPPARSHRVRPGDSLWSIADDLLPAAAPVAEVDATWRRIYRANRRLVGTDPNLIVPGTTLRLPGPPGRTSGDDPRQADPRPARCTTDRKDAS